MSSLDYEEAGGSSGGEWLEPTGSPRPIHRDCRSATLVLTVASGVAAFALGSHRLMSQQGGMGRTTGLSSAEVPFVVLEATIRDFRDSHPDFQPTYSHEPGVTTDLVEPLLGPDSKPAFKGCGGALSCPVSTETNFNQWYRTVDGVNKEIKKDLIIESRSVDADGNPVFRYDMPNFFPINNEGWGDVHQWVPYNYYFTMEAMQPFVYHGHEYFKFRGDDDVWIFFNGHLGLDLGGLHEQATKTVHLKEKAEELELELGQSVMMHIFFAERAFSSSNFKMETNIHLAEDPCVEWDRINLEEKPVAMFSWRGKAIRAHEDDGIEVSVNFDCIDGACTTDQGKGYKGGFPAFTVPAGGYLTLSLAVTDFDLESLMLSFWDLEEGESIEIAGLSAQTMMKHTSITYAKVDHKDVFKGVSPAEEGDEPIAPQRLNQEHKNKAVTLALYDPTHSEITLRNEGDADALFQFAMAPQLLCIPCEPACAATNTPMVHTQTTTVTTSTSTSTTAAPAEVSAITAEHSAYQCCLAGFTIPLLDKQISVPPCYDEKTQWLFPWCPEEPVEPAARRLQGPARSA